MRTFKEVLTEYLQSNREPIPTTSLESICADIIREANPSHVPLLTFIRDTVDGKPSTQPSMPVTPPEQKITIYKKD